MPFARGEGRSVQAFDGGHLSRADIVQRGLAGAHCLTIQMNRARPAHADAAAILCSGKLQQIAQGPQQGHIAIGVDGAPGPIYFQCELSHGSTP